MHIPIDLADPIARYQTQFRSVFQEDISRRLLWTNSDTIVCDNGACRGRHFEFLSSEFKNGREWCRLGNTQSTLATNEQGNMEENI